MRMLYLYIIGACCARPNLSFDTKSSSRHMFNLKSKNQPSKVTKNAYLADKQPSCSKNPNFKSISNDKGTSISKDCKDNACSKITSHVGQDVNFSAIDIDQNSRINQEEQSNPSHCFRDIRPCQEGFVQITQDQNDVSEDINDPNQIEQSTENSNNGKNAAFPGWKPGEIKSVSYANSSDEISVPPKPSAPTLDEFDNIDSNNMNTLTYLRLANLHVFDTEFYNMNIHSPPHPSAPEIDFTDNINVNEMHMYSYLHQPSADNNDYNSTIFKNNHCNPSLSRPLTSMYANNNINHTYMPHNSYKHQSIGPSENLHSCRQFSNTHFEPSSFTFEYNENSNCNGKHVNIINGTCPYSITSAENTKAMPQPITNDFNKQRTILDKGNSTAITKPDMLSNLISPENFLNNSASFDYTNQTKEEQESLKIPKVNQNGRTNTNYNKYGKNLSESFLCQNQDIGKRNTCPYPTENNIYTDVLLSPTNNLSNPMLIYQINSKHEVFKNLKGPNYSSRITYDKKDIILNAPKNSQKNSLEPRGHLSVENYVNAQHKINKNATSNIKYGNDEKKPLEGRTSNKQEVQVELIQAQCKDKNSKRLKKIFAAKRQALTAYLYA